MTAACTGGGRRPGYVTDRSSHGSMRFFPHGPVAVSDGSARGRSSGRCGFEPRHGRETAEKGEILHLLSVAPGL